MQFLFGRKVSGPLQCDLSLIFHLAFVSNQVDANVLACMLPDLVKPIRQVGKCLLSCHVIGKENTMSPTVEDARHRLKRLLPCCVPNLKFDNFFIYFEAEGTKFYTDSNLVFNFEFVIHDSLHEATLAYPSVSDDNQLKQVVLSGERLV
jgi:hypothetical protein